MPTAPAVQLALLGGAHIHTPNFISRLQARHDPRVAAVWDHDAARAQRRAEALGAPVRALDEILADPAIIGAVICSETSRHRDLVLAACAARKHLFVEKPLASDSDEAHEMAEAIADAGVIFQTGYFMRGHPNHLFLREQLQQGAFGTVTRVRVSNCHAGALRGLFDDEWRWMADPAIAGCGGFGDLGTHALDLLLWLLGEDQKVTAVTATLGNATGRYGTVDEYGEGLLTFASGTIGSLAAGWVDTANPVSLEICGTAGHAVIMRGDLYIESAALRGADGKRPWRRLPPLQPHAFDLFLDALTGQRVPLVGPAEAARRSVIMAALYQAANERRRVTL